MERRGGVGAGPGDPLAIKGGVGAGPGDPLALKVVRWLAVPLTESVAGSTIASDSSSRVKAKAVNLFTGKFLLGRGWRNPGWTAFWREKRSVFGTGLHRGW